MRRALGMAAVVIMGGTAWFHPGSAGAVATPPGTTAFSGYATSTALHTNVLQTAAAGPLLENTAIAFSGASVNSTGLTAPVTNEMGLGVQPPKPDKETYGRGSGLEVGVAKALPNNPDTNQVILGGLAEAAALPLEAPTPAAGPLNAFQTGVQTREAQKQTVNPVIFASVLRGQAQALWNDQSALAMLGNPLGFGLGFADDVQLINAGTAPATGEPLTAPVVATDTTAASGERTTSQTISFSYLVNNGDGTCGLASESRMTLAPLRVNLPPDANPANDTTIEILGEFILRSVATGKAPGTVTFAPANGGPNEPILRIIQPSGINNVLTFQQVLGEPGLVREVLPLLSIAVGEKPRAIAAVPTANPDVTKPPVTTITEASAAVDILRLRLLPGVTTAAGVNALDLRLGHFEAKAVVPEGGINCEIPVTKSVSPNPAVAGSDVTFTITIPTSADILVPFPCELAKLRVVDVTSVKSGNPRFTVIGGTGPAGQAGVVEGNTITFPDIGSYKPGDPPLTVKVVVRLAANSEPGELQDDVTVTATPENCTSQANAVGRAIGAGNGAGSLAGLSGLSGSGLAGGGGIGLTGTTRLSGPVVERPQELPRTGAAATIAPVALVLLGAAMVTRRLRSRVGHSS